MAGKTIYMLIKIFDKEAYADAFFNQGEMYCQTLGDFKLMEGDADRGDQYEGVTAWHQPDKISSIAIHLKAPEGNARIININLNDLAGPLIMQQTWLGKLNLFCMYAMRSDKFPESFENEEEGIRESEKINTLLQTQCEIHDGVSAFGEFAVVIHDVKSFVEKVWSTAKEMGIQCESQLVEYYDPDTFHGDFEGMKAAFNKRNIYEYQNEYRFCFLMDGTSGPQNIHIGSLAKMAVKMPTKDLKSTLRPRFDIVMDDGAQR